MVTSLKHRLALAALVGALLIPLVTSNTQGLSHLLFCRAEVAQPFAVAPGAVDTGEETAQVTSSTAISRDDDLAGSSFEGDAAVTDFCDGVRAEVSAQPLSGDRVLLNVAIVNDSTVPWRGSIALAAQGSAGAADLTAAIGEVAPGERGEATLELRVPEGQTDIDGTLLLGP